MALVGLPKCCVLQAQYCSSSISLLHVNVHSPRFKCLQVNCWCVFHIFQYRSQCFYMLLCIYYDQYISQSQSMLDRIRALKSVRTVQFYSHRLCAPIHSSVCLACGVYIIWFYVSFCRMHVLRKISVNPSRAVITYIHVQITITLITFQRCYSCFIDTIYIMYRMHVW